MSTPSRARAALARVADPALEVTVAASFARPGIRVRRALGAWPDPPSIAGRRVLITGATSGLGRAAALAMARLGASVAIVGRDPARTAAAAREIRASAGTGQEVEVLIADLASLAATRALAADLAQRSEPLDVLIHNAGALTARHVRTEEGFESTWAAQVLSPHVLTVALLPRLRAAGGRVLTMSSGGMYTVRLEPTRMQMAADAYDGVKAYALAKRAQVVMTEQWAARLPGPVQFHSLHPGWADTPGVRSSLPGFHRVTKPFLRTPEEGADTLVWLAAVAQVPGENGSFWLDRRPRSTLRLPGTAAPPEAPAALWDLVCAQSGAVPEVAGGSRVPGQPR